MCMRIKSIILAVFLSLTTLLYSNVCYIDRLVHQNDINCDSTTVYSFADYIPLSNSQYVSSINSIVDTLALNDLTSMYVWLIAQKNDTIYTYIRDWSFELLFSEKNIKKDILGVYKRNNKYFFIRTIPNSNVMVFLQDNFVRTNDSTCFKFKNIVVPDNVFIITPDVSTIYHGYYTDYLSTTILFQYFDKNRVKQRNK